MDDEAAQRVQANIFNDFRPGNASFDLGAVSACECVCFCSYLCVRGSFYAPVSAKLIIYIYISGSSRVSVKASSQQQQMLDKIFPIMRSILRFHSAFALQSSSSSSSSSLPVISYIT